MKNQSPKQADEAAETETSDSDEELSTAEQSDDLAEKDVTPTPEPKPEQKTTHSTTALPARSEWTSERGYPYKPAAEQKYPFFLEESQNKILTPEIIFKQISSMKEYLNKTCQTSGTINLLDEDKEVSN